MKRRVSSFKTREIDSNMYTNLYNIMKIR